MYSCSYNIFLFHLCDLSLQKILLNSPCLNLPQTKNITFLQNRFPQTFLAIKHYTIYYTIYNKPLPNFCLLYRIYTSMKPIKFPWILHCPGTGTLLLSWGQCPARSRSDPCWAGSLSDPRERGTHRDDWVHTVLENLFAIKADLGPSANSCLLLIVQVKTGNIMYCFPLFIRTGKSY